MFRRSRAPRLARSLAAATITVALLVPFSTASADDITPPTGTVTIGDGSGWSSSLDLTVHAPATDDIGVVSMSIFVNGVPAGTRAYAPDFALTVASEGDWDIGVQWKDAVGNSTVGHDQVRIDTTPPSVQFVAFYDDPNPHDDQIPATIGNAWDNGSMITHVRFRTGTGAWGTPIPVVQDTPMIASWPAFDPAFGGSPIIGLRTVSIEVQNQAGLWSTSVSTTLDVPAGGVTLHVDGDLRTGHPVTITPVFGTGYGIPAGYFCRWEFRWGTTEALDTTFTGDTFGGLLFDVPAAAGGCGPWTLTLPWVPYRQFDVVFSLGHTESDGGQSFADDAHLRFLAGADSTERRILSSTLPIAQVLPSTYTPIVGQPITYTRYLIGGATECCHPRWVARLGDGERPIQWTKSGGSTFTITPTAPGDLNVGWDRQAANGLLLSGYYDPPVRYPDHSVPAVTAPTQRVSGAVVSSTIPVTVAWTGSDKGWGIGSYQLQKSVNGGAWTFVALPSPTARLVLVQAAPGSTLRFRVRAKDKAANLSAWASGPTFKVVPVSDSNPFVVYTPNRWTPTADGTALGGSLHESSLAASASYRVSARAIAWVAERGAGHGKAYVYIDNVLRATVDLGARTDARHVVFSYAWASVGTHTIRITNAVTTGRPLIDVDGLIVLR